MRRLLFRYFPVLLLSGFVCASTPCWFGNNAPWLTDAEVSDWASSQHAYRAAKAGSDAARTWLSKTNHDNPYWLLAAAELGDADAQYRVAMVQPERSDLLGAAASQGHLDAQYRYALSQEHMPNRLQWLNKAAENGSQQAVIALSQWYIQGQDWASALPWLEQAAAFDSDSAVLLAKYQWRQGQYRKSTSQLKQAAKDGNAEGQALSIMIGRYWQQEVELAANKQCQQRLGFVATSLASMMHAEEILKQFQQDERLAPLPICVTSVHWLKNKTMQCSDRWQGALRLGCDVTALATTFSDADNTHLVIFADKGKANVHNGIMYLDNADSYSVFVHELAHFSGFIDEYPLPTSLAEQFCYPGFEGPNVKVLADPAPVEDSISDDGVEQSEKPDAAINAASVVVDEAIIDMAKTRTCERIDGVTAYKRSHQLTFMEYHDTNEIPWPYMQQWQQVLSQNRALTPFHINIAQGLESAGKIEAAQLWWQKARGVSAVPAAESIGAEEGALISPE